MYVMDVLGCLCLYLVNGLELILICLMMYRVFCKIIILGRKLHKKDWSSDIGQHLFSIPKIKCHFIILIKENILIFPAASSYTEVVVLGCSLAHPASCSICRSINSR